jgi:catechol 2,3-dioxygenase-like lactoylglutathione lyase family enzyme
MPNEAPPAVHYHVGIVVPDLEAAQARLTELLGVRWGPVMAVGENHLRDAEGNDLVVPTKLCYSADEPRLELIEETPGTVWVCNEHSNLHHIGFWTADLPAESARLSAARCPLQLAGREGADSPVTFGYHRDDLGVRIEIVDEAIRPMMEQFLFTATED